MESLQIKVLNPERLRSLEKWLKETNTSVSQVNGQRLYGGPPDEWDGPVPGSGCEVYICQIPRDTYEDQLIPLFSSVSPLWEFRLMMNFSGQNRGFAYAKYGTPALARVAIKRLNGHMLEPGVYLNVQHSVEKCRLFIGHLPLGTQQQELHQALVSMTEGVEDVSLQMGPAVQGVSALVVYSSHHTASMAKKVLAEAFKKRFSMTISIKWHQAHSRVNNGNKAVPSTPPKRTPGGPSGACLPPRLQQPSMAAKGFNRAVGAPVPLPPPPPAFVPLVAKVLPCPISRLYQWCDVSLGCKPLVELEFTHNDPTGNVHFAYRVRLPGWTRPLSSTVTTSLGPCAESMLDEAYRKAARQVLCTLQHLTS